MNGKKAKLLRRAALEEMIGDGVPKRDLVWGKRSVVNSPQSIRALYLKLKGAYKRTFCEPKLVAVRRRKVPATGSFYRPRDTTRGPALIQSPLKQILAKFPAVKNANGGWDYHSTYIFARDLANLGDGYTVKAIARFA